MGDGPTGQGSRLDAFSTHRLGAEPVPADVALLLPHADNPSPDGLHKELYHRYRREAGPA